MKNFTSVADVSDLPSLLKTAFTLKKNPLSNSSGRGKTLVLLFFNPSLRTRLSTEKAGLNLGMQVMVMNAAQGWQLGFEEGMVMNGGEAEHIKEAAAVISQYADIIGIRSFPSLTDREKDFRDEVLQKFIEYAQVPVVSLESAILHPLQSLADHLTIEENKKRDKPVVVLSWAPHPRALPQAVSNSFLHWMATTDYELRIAHPEGYELAPEFAANIPVYHDQKAAFEGADFVYAKNWSSYKDYGKVLHQDAAWMIDEAKMSITREGYFMHCLPVRRNVVVADEILDGPRSLVIQQANNRTYAAQAVLQTLLQGL